MLTLTEFLLARIAEDEAVAAPLANADTRSSLREGSREYVEATPSRVLAECEAKRRIVELHKSWPVLVETPPTFEPIKSADPSQFAMRASQQIAWTTEQKYREHFGAEPPTGPILRALALPYADHEDFREEWAL